MCIQGIYGRLCPLVLLVVRRLKALPETLHMHAMESEPTLYVECLTPHLFHLFPHEFLDLVGFRGAIAKRYFCDVASLLFKINTVN